MTPDDTLWAWLESRLTLHTGIDLLYVVDGYEVSATANDGNTILASADAPSLREAVLLVRDQLTETPNA